MQPPKNAGSPQERRHLRISLAHDKFGRGKRERLLLSIRDKVLLIGGIGIVCVLCLPLLPILGPWYLLDVYKESRGKAGVKNGILPNELAASRKTTVYISSRDVGESLGRTNIEYSKSAEKASFNLGSEEGRYWVCPTRKEGLFMLVATHRKIAPHKVPADSYYRCDLVRVHGGYNHGDFDDKYPMGSHDCVVLVCNKIVTFPPSRDIIAIPRRTDRDDGKRRGGLDRPARGSRPQKKEKSKVK